MPQPMPQGPSPTLSGDPFPIATFVHDLGNLVQIASSAVSIVARDPDIASSPALDRIVAEAGASLERAGALIRQSLEAGRLTAVEDIDIEAAMQALRPMIEQVCGARIRLELRVQRTPKVACRRLDLENAILNLVLNARDAMPDGGVLTICGSVAEGPENPEIQVTVADTGMGMPSAVAARATEPYFTTKPKGRGSGIGLTSVARFVAESRGRLLIQSAPGAGTSITIRLPASGAWLFG